MGKAKFLLSVALTVVGVALLAYFVPWREVAAALGEVPPAALTLGLGLYALSYLLRSLRWKFYYREVPFGILFFTTAANTFLNNLLPARLGEGSIFLLLGRYDPSLKETLKKFLKVRLLDGFALLTLFVLSLVSVKAGPLWGLAAAAPVYPVGVLLLNALSVVHPKLPRLGFETLPFFLSLGALGAKLAAVYSVLHFLSVPFWVFAVGFLGGEISTVLPLHSLAGLGTYEASFSAALKLFLGVDFKEGFKVAFVSHAFLLGASALFGLLSLALLAAVGRPGRS
ncbi:MAG: hypothetical protein GXO08_05080 [Aquificae bacterium]|nr:hypothetical protein [Aquificota bacterium]